MDLQVKYKVYYSSRNRFSYLQKVEEAIATKPKAIFVLPYKKLVGTILKKAQLQNVDVVFINNNISEEDVKEVGEPREKYKNWLGIFYPNDRLAGKLAMDCLLEKIDKKEKHFVIGINGTTETEVSNERGIGLMDSIRAFQLRGYSVESLGFVTGRWEVKRGYLFADKYYPIYKNKILFWNASDLMAQGVVTYAKEKKVKLLNSGIDWSKVAFDNVLEGSQVCTVGGHFIEPAIALIALFDYYKGIDFKTDLGLKSKTNFFQADAQNARRIRKIYSDNFFQDFKQFSKYYNKKLTRYEFDKIFDVPLSGK